ncbi:hypothetical protein SAMN05216359_11298 [Roseateles sp. YR242]|nr:hypothetical protein SAMN05216359_11298 [Roseateles sp. YR242]
MAAGVVAAAALLGGAAGLKAWRHHQFLQEDLLRRVEAVQPILANSPGCEDWLAGRMPLIVVVMGQSNAANHADTRVSRPPMAVLHDGRCVMAKAPLPGGTGTGGSLWSALNERLQGQWRGRPIVWVVVAVEGTALEDWIGDASPLRRLWERQIDATVATGWPIAAVLWQQGEADAINSTAAQDYVRGMRRLRALTEARGLPGPWWLAQSTYCPPAMGPAIRAAIQDLVDEPTNGFRAGPDTDRLQGAARNGCHFSADGVEQAATLWHQALTAR